MEETHTRQGMTYTIEVTEEAKRDLSYFTAYERKRILQGIRKQLSHNMKTINLQQEPLTLSQLFEVAQAEPILLLTPDGQEFILSQADRFEQEVEALRNSQRFQAFLDERMGCQTRIPFEELEQEVEEELRREARLVSSS